MSNREQYIGIALALLAVVIWSGNFIVARDLIHHIPPVSLNFYRWLCATLLLAPFAWKQTRDQWPVIRRHINYLLLISLLGITLFNSFVYIGAHYTTAINMALIGTTSSPIWVVILARIFLKEKIYLAKAIGVMLCISGVLYLLGKGDLSAILQFRFGRGDLWLLLAGLSFAIYNVMVRIKPKELSALAFLFASFCLGTLLLLPYSIWETSQSTAVEWDTHLILSVLYLGLGPSVICFFIWNLAIARLGAGRTALFGNLIPVFSSMEAVFMLNEKISYYHFISFGLVIAGLIFANLKTSRPS